MTLKVQVSQVIDRPVAVVFHFYADEHVRNHPRWDPDIHLSRDSNEPLGVGSIIQRRNTRSGAPVDGTMQVTAFERERLMAALIHDGPVEMRGSTQFEALGPSQTRITVTAEIPSLDESADSAPLKAGMQRSVDNVKRLIESEL